MNIFDSKNPIAISAGFLVAIFVVGYLFVIQLTASQTHELEKLRSNQVKWEFLSLNHFSYQAVHGCMFIVKHAVQENNGEVSVTADTHNNSARQPYLIRDLFVIAKNAIKGSHKYNINYHPDYGFPLSLKIDWKEQVLDDECFYTIEELKIIEDK